MKELAWFHDLREAKVPLVEGMLVIEGWRILSILGGEDGLVVASMKSSGEIARWQAGKPLGGSTPTEGAPCTWTPDLRDRPTFLLCLDEAERRGIAFCGWTNGAKSLTPREARGLFWWQNYNKQVSVSLSEALVRKKVRVMDAAQPAVVVHASKGTGCDAVDGPETAKLEEISCLVCLQAMVRQIRYAASEAKTKAERTDLQQLETQDQIAAALDCPGWRGPSLVRRAQEVGLEARAKIEANKGAIQPVRHNLLSIDVEITSPASAKVAAGMAVRAVLDAANSRCTVLVLQ